MRSEAAAEALLALLEPAAETQAGRLLLRREGEASLVPLAPTAEAESVQPRPREARPV